MIDLIDRVPRICSERLRLETIPVVIVRSRPNGLPIAKTRMPTRRSDESPTSIGKRTSRGASILITAMSLLGSAPTSLASYVFPSNRVIPTSWASSITWKLVKMCPSRSRTDPEPEPSDETSSSRIVLTLLVVMLTTPLLLRSYTATPIASSGERPSGLKTRPAGRGPVRGRGGVIERRQPGAGCHRGFLLGQCGLPVAGIGQPEHEQPAKNGRNHTRGHVSHR